MLKATLTIAEIGHTGVGKTTFMASMYQALQTPIEHFSLRAVKNADHDRLLKLAAGIQQGRYPDATDQRSEYKFYLKYRQKNVLNFNWADYRGGALIESQSSPQSAQLLRDLRRADGILMFCDMEALAQRNLRRNQLGRMISLVNTALSDGINHPISLAIILTKADLVQQFDDSMLAPLNGLIEVIQASETVLGCCIPVACGTDPLNLALPILFTLHLGVCVKVQALSEEMLKNYEMAEFYAEKTNGIRGWLTEVWDRSQGNVTNRDRAAVKYQQAATQYEEYQSIIESAQALDQYIQSI